MTIEGIGIILKKIRIEVVKLSQLQLAEKINCKQASISRLELGKGAALDVVLNILDYYQKNQIPIHYIFMEPFNYELLKNGTTNNVKQLIEILQEIQTNNRNDFEKIKLILSTL